LIGTLATALAVLVWYIFAPQCASTLAVIRRETGSWKWMAVTFAYMLTLAYSRFRQWLRAERSCGELCWNNEDPRHAVGAQLYASPKIDNHQCGAPARPLFWSSSSFLGTIALCRCRRHPWRYWARARSKNSI
jgi:hypothetical protein